MYFIKWFNTYENDICAGSGSEPYEYVRIFCRAIPLANTPSTGQSRGNLLFTVEKQTQDRNERGSDLSLGERLMSVKTSRPQALL